MHGTDPDHPLSTQDSVRAANAAIGEVYHAIDTLIAELFDAFPDVVTMVFTPHGMGVNNSDVASMVLLPDLLARWSGQATPDLAFPVDEHGVVSLGPDQSWGDALWRKIDGRTSASTVLDAPRRLRSKVTARLRHRTSPGVDWMPLVRHQPNWSTMRAFALPSYYDGRIRVNLAGRESQGRVQASDYDAVLDELETMLRACHDPHTGEPLVASFDRPIAEPLAASDDSADLIVHWRGAPYGVEHEALGRIGPIPPRRTGGHTSPYGAVFITGPDVKPGDLGDRSPFDLLPTAFDLVGCDSPWELSGQPFSSADRIVTDSALTRLVSVVIPVRNGAATIGEQLDALCDQAPGCHEIVIVDNGSTDDTLTIVDRFRDRIPNLRVVDGSALRGIAEVRNLAMAASVGDLLCCDADDIVAPTWVHAMTAALDRYDIVGGRIDESRLNLPTATARTAQGDGLPAAWNYLPFCIGANTAIRRSVLEDLGGWNLRYSTAAEDIDLCYRAQLAGYTIGFAPDAVVYYRHREVPGPLRRQQARYAYSAAQLHRDFRALGMPRGPISGLVNVWAKVLLVAPVALVMPSQRLFFQRLLGAAQGATHGMVAERAWPF